MADRELKLEWRKGMEDVGAPIKDIRAEISFVSTEKVTEEEIKILSVGGHAIKVNYEGKEYDFCFDWNASWGYATNQGDGTILVEFELADFAYEDFYLIWDFIDIKREDVTPEFLTSHKLQEVYYECFKDENEELPVALELKSFVIHGINDAGETVSSSYSEEQIKAYNKYNRGNAEDGK